MRRVLAIIATLLLPLASHAASDRKLAPGGWSAQGELTQAGSYNSNPLRTVNNGEDLFGATTSPELTLRYRTPLSMLESATRVDVNAFNHTRYNSTDLHQNFLLGTANERWATGLKASIDHDTTRTSELTNYALNLPKVRRTKLAASPKIIFRPTARDSIGVNSSVASITYDNNAYTDYKVYGLSPYYERQFDQKNFGTLALTASRYESTSGSSLTSESYGPQIGWITNHTDKLSTRFTAGVESTHKSGVNAGSDRNAWNYVFSGSMNYKGDVDTVSLVATRAREPFGNGTETLLTSVALNERHAINEKLALKTRAAYQTAGYTTEPGINLDHGISAGTGLSYTLSDDLDLNADYGFRHEKLTNSIGDAKQHSVMLGVNYHPSWSRN